ncbi:MAG: hypothetical protein NT085_04880 [candidate division SR1 bacterium]|nr:hypothetical protein [candidate division SR1 bacterium]
MKNINNTIKKLFTDPSPKTRNTIFWWALISLIMINIIMSILIGPVYHGKAILLIVLIVMGYNCLMAYIVFTIRTQDMIKRKWINVGKWFVIAIVLFALDLLFAKICIHITSYDFTTTTLTILFYLDFSLWVACVACMIRCMPNK